MEPEMNSHKCLPSNPSVYQNVLEHMASIDPIELCNESKIEHCRATRDLSSCGRYVKHVLDSCGHAALCAECSQRCDVCPICRTALPTSGSKVRLRLYYKCIEAGLISKKLDDRFQEKKDIGEHSLADIERLYSLFDVALDNNLVSLICHYVTDVCMDENAVSSDPVRAFLLDEVVVKDWCKRKFKRIIHELSGIYTLGIEAMKDKMNLLQKFVLQLTGVSSVLEVMDASFKETLSAQLHDLHQLLESTLKTKQHLEVMIWCIQHQFLEDVPSRYPDSASWNRLVRERKSAAVKRAWPNVTSNTVASGPNEATLFIEEALSNLGIEESYNQDIEEDLDIACLQHEHSPLLFLSKIDEGNTNRKEGCYPFGNLRVAADVLFLHGTSDMVLAKQAIFLYYLFDRQWTRPDSEWRYLADDFAAFFGITRLALLESLTFYLLDDDSDQTLQEASILLPQIAGPETHPKIAQVLLERLRPDIALSVLRCTGHDGTCAVANSESVSLNQAVTAVRVKIECGLLTEAFMYQRMHCSRVKEDDIKRASPSVFSESLTLNSWNHHVEVLVSEICYLCSRRNLVDRIIELPWNSDEEKYFHSCLFEYARQDPLSVHGSLLVVFYLQRYRYIEAYQVDRELQKLEHNITVSASEEVASRIRSISHWRAAMIDKSVNLLPEVERKKVTSTNVFDSAIFGSHAIQTTLPKDFSAESENPVAMSNSSVKPSVLLANLESRKASPSAHTSLSSPRGGHPFEFGNKGPSIIQRRLLNASERPSSRINTLGGGMSFPHTSNGEYSPSNGNIVKHPIQQNSVKQGYQSAGLLIPTSNPISLQSTPQREAKAAAPGLLQNDWQLHGSQRSFGFEPNDIAIRAESSHSLLPRVIPEDSNNLINAPHNNGSHEGPYGDQNSLISGKRNLLDRSLSNLSSEEASMNIRRVSPTKELNTKGMPRWRSDESSEDEEDPVLRKHRAGNTPFVMPRRAKHPWR